MLMFCLIIRKPEHQKLKKIHSCHHHVIGILNKFHQNHTPPALNHLTKVPTFKISNFCHMLIHLPVFWECHHQNTYTLSNLLQTATPHCQRFTTSLPKVHHLTAKGTTSHCQRYNISLLKVQHLTTKGTTSHCLRYNTSMPKVQHLNAKGTTSHCQRYVSLPKVQRLTA